MAPLPTIGNCVRVSINWSRQAGVAPVNVFHLITDSTNETEIGLALDEAQVAAGANVWSVVQETYRIVSYTITLLDGESAGVDVPCTETLGGQATGNLVPQVAGCMNLYTPQRGPRGRGRMFMGPVGEGVITDGLVSEAARNNTLGAWDDLQDELAGSTIAASLGVASYVHAEVNGVTRLGFRQAGATQRRRQNQLV